MAGGLVVAPDQGDRTCTHLEGLRQPSGTIPDGCEECLAAGTQWVHLRECLGCGHIGCCDSSPQRHATAHEQSSGHPVIASAEIGEDWAWCYPDELILVPGS